MRFCFKKTPCRLNIILSYCMPFLSYKNNSANLVTCERERGIKSITRNSISGSIRLSPINYDITRPNLNEAVHEQKKIFFLFTPIYGLFLSLRNRETNICHLKFVPWKIVRLVFLRRRLLLRYTFSSNPFWFCESVVFLCVVLSFSMLEFVSRLCFFVAVDFQDFLINKNKEMALVHFSFYRRWYGLLREHFANRCRCMILFF